jgi:hypothetical protein
MIIIRICLLSLFAMLSLSAQDLVFDYAQLVELDKRLNSEDIIYKRRLARDRVILRRDLGRPYSHFFKINGSIQRLYQDFQKNCYRLIVTGQLITANASRCEVAPKLKVAGYDGFQEIHYPMPEELHTDSLLLKEEGYTASYQGFSFMYHLKDLYLPAQKPPLDTYHFTINATSEVMIAEKSFKLVQKVNFLRSQFHFYTPRIKETIQTIEFSKGDLLFTNNKGQFILYKRYQPAPLNFKYLWLNPDHQGYLEGVDDYLYSYEQQKVCFMDNHLNHSAFDCEKIAIKNMSAFSYQTFNLILIDTVTGGIQFL